MFLLRIRSTIAAVLPHLWAGSGCLWSFERRARPESCHGLTSYSLSPLAATVCAYAGAYPEDTTSSEDS